MNRKFKGLNCCEKCQNYWTCETKWYRGEHDRENVCCDLCNSYLTCWDMESDPADKKPRP